MSKKTNPAEQKGKVEKGWEGGGQLILKRDGDQKKSEYLR